MKNLHVIPTDKPSKLFKVSNELKLTRKYDFYNGAKYQNIYITNSEEIKKEGDYGLSKLNEIIKFHSGYDYRYYAKIILTTDQDLIKDGVQPIDDEFLEWFVKNPSCDCIEVEDANELLRSVAGGVKFYKIIIPQEEPIQELNLNCFDCNKSLQDCTCMEDTIDMTDPLEQAAKEYAEMHLDVSGNLGKYLVKAVFQDGVKWEQEQDKNKYSEEEVIELLCDFFDDHVNCQNANISQWFEKCKKK